MVCMQVLREHVLFSIFLSVGKLWKIELQENEYAYHEKNK